jgi:hypothetical protein
MDRETTDACAGIVRCASQACVTGVADPAEAFVHALPRTATHNSSKVVSSGSEATTDEPIWPERALRHIPQEASGTVRHPHHVRRDGVIGDTVRQRWVAR